MNSMKFNINLVISRCTAVNPATKKRESAILLSREYRYNGAYNFDYDEIFFLFFNPGFSWEENEDPECTIDLLRLFISGANFTGAPILAHANDFAKYDVIMED